MNRKRRRNQIIATLIGLFLVFTFAISLIGPQAFDDEEGSVTFTPAPTRAFSTPTPTPVVVPTINPEGPDLDFGLPELGTSPGGPGSGVFLIPRPAGEDWRLDPAQSSTSPDGTIFNTVYISPERLAVIHAILQTDVNYRSLETVQQEVMTNRAFDENWREYDRWELVDQQQDEVFLTYNFRLFGDTTYLARQIVWLEQNLLYALRIIVPENNPALLEHIQEEVVPSFISYPHLIEPLTTTAPSQAKGNVEEGYIIKVPVNWQPIGREEGPSRSYIGIGNNENYQITARLEAENTPLTTLDEAESWLRENRELDEILGGRIAPEQRFATYGYMFSYIYRDFDGNPRSAAIVLLNDEVNNLYTAEMRIPESDIDLLRETASQPHRTALQVLNTFTVLAPEDYIYQPEPFVPSIALPFPPPADWGVTEESLAPPIDDAPPPDPSDVDTQPPFNDDTPPESTEEVDETSFPPPDNGAPPPVQNTPIFGG